jgi:CheY-like chemotaxis protein
MSELSLLLVEDSEDDVFFFKWIFQKASAAWRLHHVWNGTAAVEFLEKAAGSGSLPELVFLDLKMPGLNGFEVLDWMRKQAFARAVPVIVLSGSAQQEDKDRSSELGATAYLVKPVTGPVLEGILQASASGANLANPALFAAGS